MKFKDENIVRPYVLSCDVDKKTNKVTFIMFPTKEQIESIENSISCGVYFLESEEQEISSEEKKIRSEISLLNEKILSLEKELLCVKKNNPKGLYEENR